MKRNIDIVFFKKALIERREQVLKNIQNFQEEIDSLKGIDLNDEADYAAISTDRLIESAITNKQAKELKEIEEALQKMEKGTYGICEMCEEPISLERLQVKPQAKYCIVCREIIEKNRKKE
ncbi:MAG: RNA polymerase-binding protein DksA [Epsilonproteobacteria bacterium]|nr:RNA polymerase-binding protein DksA [Campylobacterota bacterium]